MTASLTDLLTAAKNIVTALNYQTRNTQVLAGQQAAVALAAATQVFTGSGRLVALSVTTAGSAPGVAYDANNVASTTSPVFDIPNAVGFVLLGIPLTNGLVIAPGTGQKVTAIYSQTPTSTGA
jgi:hypothetical protein